MTHYCVTQDCDENAANGLLICGINFGLSADDERDESKGVATDQETKSFFSDSRVNNTTFRNRIVDCFTLWDVPLQTQADFAGAYEKAIIQSNWLITQSNKANDISKKILLDGSDGIIGLIKTRKPKLILFFGVDLIEVFNDISLRSDLEKSLGNRSGNAITLKKKNAQGTQFTAMFQSFGDTQIVSIPHVTGSWGIDDAFLEQYRDSIGGAIRKWKGIYL